MFFSHLVLLATQTKSCAFTLSVAFLVNFVATVNRAKQQLAGIAI